MKQAVLMVMVCLLWVSCKGPSDGEGCTPIADADKEVELVYPISGTFDVGDVVDVAWKMNPNEVSQVAIQLSTTGVNGPWRQVFSKGISTDNPTADLVCKDTIWVVGDEYENINFSSTETVLLRVTEYGAEGTEWATDVSNSLTINP